MEIINQSQVLSSFEGLLLENRSLSSRCYFYLSLETGGLVKATRQEETSALAKMGLDHLIHVMREALSNASPSEPIPQNAGRLYRRVESHYYTGFLGFFRTLFGLRFENTESAQQIKVLELLERERANQHRQYMERLREQREEDFPSQDQAIPPLSSVRSLQNETFTLSHPNEAEATASAGHSESFKSPHSSEGEAPSSSGPIPQTKNSSLSSQLRELDRLSIDEKKELVNQLKQKPEDLKEFLGSYQALTKQGGEAAIQLLDALSEDDICALGRENIVGLDLNSSPYFLSFSEGSSNYLLSFLMQNLPLKKAQALMLGILESAGVTEKCFVWSICLVNSTLIESSECEILNDRTLGLFKVILVAIKRKGGTIDEFIEKLADYRDGMEKGRPKPVYQAIINFLNGAIILCLRGSPPSVQKTFFDNLKRQILYHSVYPTAKKNNRCLEVMLSEQEKQRLIGLCPGAVLT